jgi:hypothetical protein
MSISVRSSATPSGVACGPASIARVAVHAQDQQWKVPGVADLHVTGLWIDHSVHDRGQVLVALGARTTGRAR